MLSTCKKIEKPPIPSKKEVRIIFIEMAFIGILEIKEIPFVISKIPVSKGATKFEGIPKIFKQGEIVNVRIFSNLLALKIEIITENITTNPPIIRIVDVAFEIEFAITSPKLERLIVFSEFFTLSEILLFTLFEELLEPFQNLNKNPTVMQAKR